MAVISFYADKIAHLAKLSINNPGHRRPSFEQRYEMSMLRDDLSATRRAQLEAGAEDGGDRQQERVAGRGLPVVAEEQAGQPL